MEVTISSSDSKGLLCHDLLFIGSAYNFHMDLIVIGGEKRIVFESLSERERENIEHYGL